MDIRTVPISQLIPAEYNPRIEMVPGDPEFEKLRQSIETFGLVEPVVWNERSCRVIGGHQRLNVLRHLGITEVDVVVVDLDDQAEKALNIALNKITGEWDQVKLREVLEQLDAGEFDVTLTGFAASEIEALIADIGSIDVADVRDDNFDIDEAVNRIIEPVSRPGDVWLLGRHRVMCGDSTNLQHVQKLVNGACAQMVFTDPPYNVAYESDDGKRIANDDMDSQQFYEFLLAAFQNAFEVTSPGAPIYIAHSESEGINFRRAMTDSGWLMKQCLIWVKNAFVLGRQDYQWKHEPILYGWKPGASHRWFGGRKQSTVLETPVPLTVSSDDGSYLLTFNSGPDTLVLRVPSYEILGNASEFEDTIWRFEKPTRSAEHPTMKPIPLVAKAIVNSSRIDDIVLDMFLGSGTTLMAAEQVERTCYGMEYEPVYCDVIVKRWEEFTGQTAVRA